MIICFSGTGNSRMIADILQDYFNDSLLRLPPGHMLHPEKATIETEGDRVIWIFPIHSWGLPKAVKHVIKKAHLIGGQEAEHYMVCTCGDDIGLADKQWRRMMAKKGYPTAGAFSIQMPNTYTFMKGFDVDAPELAASKLEKAKQDALDIAQLIDEGSTLTKVVRGKHPWFKSKIIYPWFMKFATSTRPFHVNEKCSGCGRCARNCPLTNIEMIDQHPHWGHNCTFCSRCYHVCPSHAVEYGKSTTGKGQYLCPEFSIKH